MPLFDYLCEKHGKFEKLISHSESYEQKCPKCDNICYKIMSQIACMKTNWAFWTKIVPPRFQKKNMKSE